MMKNVWRQKCHLVTRKIRDPLYTTFQKIFTIIRIFLKSEAPKALYSSHSFIVSALMTMHTTPFRSLPADPAWGAGCVACVRSLPMRDRARAMRPARYVGPAGKERF